MYAQHFEMVAQVGMDKTPEQADDATEEVAAGGDT